MKSEVETVDINRLRQDNIYINLFNKYAEQIKGKKFNEKVKIIGQCKNEKEYQEASALVQEQLFTDLINL